jgi:hypothetical protein
MPFALAELLVVTMAPPGSSRPSLTYTDQTLEALLPAITPCLNFSNGWKAVTRSSRLNEAGAPEMDLSPLGFVPKEAGSKLFTRTVKAREQ